MGGIHAYSGSPNSNTTINGIDVDEGCAPSGINNAIRQEMADTRNFADDIGGKAVSTGTDTIEVTTSSVVTSYYDGLRATFIAGGANTGAATLNLDSVGAKALLKHGGDALTAGDIAAGMAVDVVYDASADSGSGAFLLLNPKVAASGTAITTDGTGQIAGLTGKATPVDADVTLIEDSAASNAKKKVTWANIKATLKTYFDTLYSPAGAIAASLLTTRGDIIYRDGSGPQRLAKGTAGHVLTMGADDPEWAAPGGGGGVVKVTKSADQTSTAATLADINDLNFAIGAGETWEFSAILYAYYVSTSGVPCISINGPASPSAVRFSVMRTTFAQANTVAVLSQHAAYDDVNTSAPSFDNKPLVFFVSGRIVNGANAGTVSLRVQRAGGSGTATIYRDSYLDAYKVP